MSNSVANLHIIKVEDTRLNLKETNTYAILSGGDNISVVSQGANSYNTSSIVFNCPPPSTNTIIDRKIFLDVTYTINFTGNAAAGTTNLLDTWGSTVSPRALPLCNSIKNLSVKLNNANFSIQLNDVIPALSHTSFKDNFSAKSLSSTPVYLDQSQTYEELLGTNRNPLSGYHNGNADNEPRGGFVGTTFVSNAPTSGQIKLRCIEPIFISPFNYSRGEVDGLYGIQTMSLYITIDSNLAARLISSSATANGINAPTFTNISVTIVDQPNIYFNYITPQVDYIPVSMPVYPYYELNRYSNDLSSLASGATVTKTLDNIQLSQYPRRIYIYAKRNTTDYTINTTDTFARIESLSIMFNNKQGILSAASPQQLYNISRSNGLEMSFNEWYGHTGVVPSLSNKSGIGGLVIIDPWKDLGEVLDAPGVLENIQLQITVRLTNLHPTAAVNFTCFVVVLDEGTLSIKDNNVYQQLGVLTRNDILKSKEIEEPINLEEAQALSADGGSFWSSLKNLVKKGSTLYKHIAPAITRAIAPQYSAPVDASVKLLESVGLGKKKGGKLLSRTQMQNLLK